MIEYVSQFFKELATARDQQCRVQLAVDTIMTCGKFTDRDDLIALTLAHYKMLSMGIEYRYELCHMIMLNCKCIWILLIFNVRFHFDLIYPNVS